MNKFFDRLSLFANRLFCYCILLGALLIGYGGIIENKVVTPLNKMTLVSFIVFSIAVCFPYTLDLICKNLKYRLTEFRRFIIVLACLIAGLILNDNIQKSDFEYIKIHSEILI